MGNTREKLAYYNIERQEALLEDVWVKIEAELKTILLKIDENINSLDLYQENILKDTEQMLQSAYAAYEVGNLDYLDLLDSIRLIYQSKIEFEKLKANQKILKANLLKTAGLISLN